MDDLELSRRVRTLFHAKLPNPPMTLRSGSAIDAYGEPVAYDMSDDALDDAYLEHYYWGLPYLDAESWRYYLPHYIDYALRHRSSGGSSAVSALLQSLRPPDHDPPRLASLSEDQENLIADFLELLAFGADSAYGDEAMQVLEEYWMPDSLYRREF